MSEKMKMLKFNIRAIAITIAALIIFIAFQQTKLMAQGASYDEVTWSSDKGQNYTTDQGLIVNEYYDGLELKSKDGVFVRKIKYEQIKSPIEESIKYEQGGNFKGRETANDLKKVAEAQKKGDFKQAIDLCNKIIAAPQLRTVFKQAALFNLALSYQNINQLDKAVQGYDDLFKAFPEGRYIREAFLGKSECTMRVKSLQEASDVLDQAKSELSKLSNMESKFILGLDLKKAFLYENNGKFDMANGIYNTVAGKAGPEVSVLAQAMVGKGRIALKSKNYTEAEKSFTKVIEIEKNDDVLAFAAAYNGRADCTLASASNQTAEVYKKALLDYLHAKLLYPTPEGASTEEEENSTYNAALCWDKLGQASTDAKKKLYYNGNARSLYEEFVSMFPYSKKYIANAQKRLSELSK
jgi:tetratricopeptide (TPR) repeat protein